MNITELNYSSTNTYLIDGTSGTLLFDTGWAGTFPALCRELGEKNRKLQDIDYILISHFHPDHMGIAQEIADRGPVIVAVDLQVPYLHHADEILEKEGKFPFRPIEDEKVRVITLKESRDFLATLGIEGEIIHTPGHSEESISLWLDQGLFFVGDLNPLYEREMHQGTQIGESWDRIMEYDPKRVYYGHAKTSVLIGEQPVVEPWVKARKEDFHDLVARIIRGIEKGWPEEKIRKKTGADRELVEDVNRMYLTHPGVGVQGILDRIEIKGK